MKKTTIFFLIVSVIVSCSGGSNERNVDPKIFLQKYEASKWKIVDFERAPIGSALRTDALVRSEVGKVIEFRKDTFSFGVEKYVLSDIGPSTLRREVYSDQMQRLGHPKLFKKYSSPTPSFEVLRLFFTNHGYSLFFLTNSLQFISIEADFYYVERVQ